MTILPGKTLGMLGGGQLGRMFTMSARTMGYKVVVLDPAENCPAGEVANLHIRANYDNEAALDNLGHMCDAVTTEFENVPANTLRILRTLTQVYPEADNVAIAQDRKLEKQFMRDHGFPIGPYALISSHADIDTALTSIEFPAVLKLCRLGYDGKGQYIVSNTQEAHIAFDQLDQAECVLEKLLPLDLEVSVIVARTSRQTIVYPVSENQHIRAILDKSIIPARIETRLAHEVSEIAVNITGKMDYQGVMGIEFFIVNGRPYVNEIAPRPHNSGHYTQDACITSQFEQQVRTLCDLPLGSTELLTPVVMINLLGDLWEKGEPKWDEVFKHPQAKLHLYGKHTARTGRKMAHINCLAPTVEYAQEIAEQIRTSLNIESK
ncbi:MAG: 5-(carboxyamino)imidazole ribonucleotide synthase [Proteobacteria bacterium]|nr:5-(carboxyamino)imidazole ribonucleotide synthase [Pseudomonadota bacterium]MDE3208997.1 5-(carboxyamino)imidazole ribonucleotide synthase [Pseudomonadota bacterium]